MLDLTACLLKTAFCSTFLTLCISQPAHSQKPVVASDRDFADLVVLNADIRTAERSNPKASAIAVRDGRFIRVGTDSSVRELVNSDTDVIDAEGKTVTPGLIDGHVHLGGGLDLLSGVDLYGIPEKQTWLGLIAEKSATLRRNQWLLGGRWDHTLSDSPLPSKEDLDSVAPDRPIYLTDVDGHSAWLNSIAIEMVGITRDTQAPDGGVIEKDPESGEPTGILKETAKRLVTQSLPFRERTRRSDEERLELIHAAIQHANSLGLTGVHDLGGIQRIRDYEELLKREDLSLRIWFGVSGLRKKPDKLEKLATTAAALAEVVKARKSTLGPELSVGYVKYFVDGVLSTHTAALIKPYSDRPDIAGLPVVAQPVLSKEVASANAAGFPVAIHAIGDRGVRMALNAFNASQLKPRLPNRVEHIELVAKEDIRRFSQENVVASMNPHHAVTTFHNYLTDRIGADREDTAYAWNSLLTTKAQLVFGSDWPTAPLNPFTQLWAAVFRESAFGRNSGAWHSENAVSFNDALYAYSQAPASASGWGAEIGSITPGKWADFVITTESLGDPIDGSRLRRTMAQSTYIAGIRVFQRSHR